MQKADKDQDFIAKASWEIAESTGGFAEIIVSTIELRDFMWEVKAVATIMESIKLHFNHLVSLIELLSLIIVEDCHS